MRPRPKANQCKMACRCLQVTPVSDSLLHLYRASYFFLLNLNPQRLSNFRELWGTKIYHFWSSGSASYLCPTANQLGRKAISRFWARNITYLSIVQSTLDSIVLAILPATNLEQRRKKVVHVLVICAPRLGTIRKYQPSSTPRHST